MKTNLGYVSLLEKLMEPLKLQLQLRDIHEKPWGDMKRVDVTVSVSPDGNTAFLNPFMFELNGRTYDRPAYAFFWHGPRGPFKSQVMDILLAGSGETNLPKGTRIEISGGTVEGIRYGGPF